jgi:hypothetical protein
MGVVAMTVGVPVMVAMVVGMMSHFKMLYYNITQV